MVDPNQYIKEGIKIIDAFLDAKNYPAALRACQELLKVNPFDRKLQKYLRKIEDRIIDENEKKVDRDLDSVEHLWKEDRFDDLYKIYTRLYQYAPQHKRLKKLLEKLVAKLSRRQLEEKSQHGNEKLLWIQAAITEKRYADALMEANELLKFDPLNGQANSYAKQLKNLIIEQKLQENERIADSADFERQLEFYESLLSINPDHPKAKKLALQAKAHLAERKLIAEKIHLNESIDRMKSLFTAGEYEKVIQSCEEIDRIDPGNFTARVFRKKALSTINAEIEELAAKRLTETWTALKPEYEKNPQGFTTI